LLEFWLSVSHIVLDIDLFDLILFVFSCSCILLIWYKINHNAMKDEGTIATVKRNKLFVLKRDHLWIFKFTIFKFLAKLTLLLLGNNFFFLQLWNYRKNTKYLMKMNEHMDNDLLEMRMIKEEQLWKFKFWILWRHKFL
jgi:hypothetical protein